MKINNFKSYRNLTYFYHYIILALSIKCCTWIARITFEVAKIQIYVH